MKLFTWNTQGNFMSPAKRQVIVNDLFTVQNCDVGFIQEGGTDHGVPLPGYSVFSGPQAGALNQRCTNYVVLKQASFPAAATFELIQAAGGGVAGRYPAAAKVGNYLFVSWHSTASAASEDTAKLFKEILSKHRGLVVVIGGDFNAQPEDVQAMVARHVGGRASKGTSLDAKPAPQVTHPHSGGTLDHFVVIGNGAETVATVAVHNVQASDHDPVVMEMQI